MDAKLYHLETCPHCRRVRDFIAHRGLEGRLDYLEVSRDADALERLVELTGRTQVPVLEVDAEPIVGSDVIIEWLDENAVALSRREMRAPHAAHGSRAGRGPM